MAKDKAPSVEELILTAAGAVRPISGDVKPWVYGWCLEDYRRSGRAGLPGQGGPVTIGLEGIHPFEESVLQLLKEPAVKDRWDRMELWGLVATLVVAVSDAEDPSVLVSASLPRLREAEASLVVLPIANVTWSEDPCAVAGGVIGRLNSEFKSAVARVADGRLDLVTSDADEWAEVQMATDSGSEEDMASNRREVVVGACWTKGQMKRARDSATRWLEDVCCLALLFGEDLEGLKMWSLRGGHNRPGLRGSVPDRTSLERLLEKDPHGSLELTLQPFVASRTFGVTRTVEWRSADPVPLDKLLAVDATNRLIDDAVVGLSAIPKRLRVAARWYADAHWAMDPDDAMLALGVALDALVGSRSGLPGRVMAQRFAHLEPDPAKRRVRQERYSEMYSVRSAVAHGGESSRIDDPGFVRSVADDVRWAARQMVALAAAFSIGSDTDVDRTFEGFALGETKW